VNRLRRPSLLSRWLLVAVLALCIGVRLLTPIGFMPSFANGSLAIVECPQADGAPVPPAMPDMPGMDMPGMAMPHAVPHDDSHAFHQTCPYAEAASLAGIEPGVVIVAPLFALVALAPLASALPVFSRRVTRDRPPSQGPPVPA
jgi:hypothetical protein